MKFANLPALCLTLLAACCFTSRAGTTRDSLVVSGKRLTVQAPPKCAQARPSGKQLARYLNQYNPADDPKEDIRDETPWTKREIQQIKTELVEIGFHYPDGQDSVITWLDFDGDGICDFTGAAGAGGMRPVDRMVLFHGLANGDFDLSDAFYTYMAGSSIVVPYIAIAVAGEKLPVLATQGSLLQWQAERKRFATCETIEYGPQAKRQLAPPALAALCPHAQRIYTWAADQMPHNNQIP